MPVPCLTCRKNMSAEAIVCPHCGARQADRDWAQVEDDAAPAPKPPLSVSADEAAALISMRGGDTLDLDEPVGPLALVLPRPDAFGVVRLLEWALTLGAAPLLVAGFVLTLFRFRFRGNALMRASEVPLTLAIGVLGVAGILSVGTLAGWSNGTLLGVVVASGGALLARLGLRLSTRR